MTAHACRRVDAYLRAFTKLMHDDRARREWLWLEARAKEDQTSLELLERGDRGLRARMAAIDRELGGIVDARARRDAYWRELNRRSPDVDGIPCACDGCRRVAAG